MFTAGEETKVRPADSLQLTAKYKVCPPYTSDAADDMHLPAAVNVGVAKTQFPKGFNAVKPYLRLTPQPQKSRLA